MSWYLKFSFRWNGSENFKLKIETTKNGYEKLLIDLSSKLKYLWDLWWIKLLYREKYCGRERIEWNEESVVVEIEEMKRVQVELQSWVPTTLVALYLCGWLNIILYYKIFNNIKYLVKIFLVLYG
jgi:hypothetical protein